MAYRVSAMDATEDFGSYVDAHDNVFGGLYYQHEPAFAVVVLVTRKASAADIASALALVPDGAPVETRVVDRSIGTLRKGVDSIDKARAANKWDIRSVGVDVVRNTVRVGRIKGAVDDDAVRSAAATSVVFHEKVGVIPTACTRTDCSPVRGGIYITNSGTGKCTLGLSAKSGTVRYLITAGHCDDGEHYWKQNGIRITNATDRNKVERVGSQIGLTPRSDRCGAREPRPGNTCCRTQLRASARPAIPSAATTAKAWATHQAQIAWMTNSSR